jgi:hypothetical protein
VRRMRPAQECRIRGGCLCGYDVWEDRRSTVSPARVFPSNGREDAARGLSALALMV